MTATDQSSRLAVRTLLERLSEAARAQWASAGDCSQYRDKGDAIFDPVTLLDCAIEDSMREIISNAYPADGVRGEERGWSNPGAARTWSIDPVDGTRALICGLPSWAVLVGVLEGDRHIAGLIDLPALNERLIACDGVTRRNDAPVRTSNCHSLEQARFSTTDPQLFEGDEAAAVERIRDAVLVTRYGLDALAYARVATGGIDLVVENKLDRHDLDALVPVVRGAGGHIGDWNGGEDWDGGRIVAAASRALYDEAVAVLAA